MKKGGSNHKQSTLLSFGVKKVESKKDGAKENLVEEKDEIPLEDDVNAKVMEGEGPFISDYYFFNFFFF